MEHSIDIRMHGVPFRITTTKGTLHFGGGWLEVRPPGGNGLRFRGVAVRTQDVLEERIARLNQLLDSDPVYEGIVISAVPLRKEVEGE